MLRSNVVDLAGTDGDTASYYDLLCTLILVVIDIHGARAVLARGTVDDCDFGLWCARFGCSTQYLQIY